MIYKYYIIFLKYVLQYRSDLYIFCRASPELRRICCVCKCQSLESIWQRPGRGYFHDIYYVELVKMGKDRWNMSCDTGLVYVLLHSEKVYFIMDLF